MPEFPKRVFIRENQPNREKWVAFFEKAYQKECERLLLTPEPLPEEQSVLAL